ncbi:histidine phosphatase family protein [Robbsia andropogonis]|uniref:histidine phosphatase family protein n=1 Tax=Robbsia andropogonis TaxID=28092 RepID=UPI002A6A00E8|nr:histidine phosphatase family protein [Robbsia andropogonis]
MRSANKRRRQSWRPRRVATVFPIIPGSLGTVLSTKAVGSGVSRIAQLRVRLRLAAQCLALLPLLAASFAAKASDVTAASGLPAPDVVETIVMVRHGEKPMQGLGQLNCQGLNRSLALPKVLQRLYGKPDVIIAPNPAILKSDLGRSYAYVRPLATIEPTAIVNGMPVEVTLGYDDRDGLVDRLLASDLQGKTVYVAWEHRIAEQVAKTLMKRLGTSEDVVPRWGGGDYDSIYVVRVTGVTGQTRTARFAHDHQHLDGVSTRCP